MLLAIIPLQAVLAVSLPPVQVTLYDANRKETHVVEIGLDGSVTDATRAEIEHAFRCRRSEREHHIDRGLLAMIAQVQQHFDGHAIEYISAYRGWKGQRHDSNHWHGKAFDFRVQGVKLTDVRDYVWTHFTGVGVGWYPPKDFVHMDNRAGEPDMAWTWRHGGRSGNHYHPSWSVRVREQHELHSHESRIGI